MEIRKMPLSALNPAPYNPRLDLQPGDPEFEKIRRSVEEFSLVEPLVWNERTGNIVGGHQRAKVLQALGYEEVDVSVVDMPLEREQALNVALNKAQGDWDMPRLRDLLVDMEGKIDLTLTAFDQADIDALLAGMGTAEEQDTRLTKEQGRRTLAERFVMPPFSVVDTRRGDWRKRKKAWRNLGIQSEIGRAENLVFGAQAQPPETQEHKKQIERALGRELSWEEYGSEFSAKNIPGTSIFDPVLTEICYRWFTPKGGTILDPFAGGSVRGIVAGFLGYSYIGVDLRAEQVEANREQANEIELQQQPIWIAGDSLDIKQHAAPHIDGADLIFSCPPYYDLEVYSDDPADISTASTYDEFMQTYRQIIKEAVSLLKPNRFAVFVVSEIRDKQGNYRNFVGDTIQAFEAAGAKYYNEMVVVTPVASLAMRASPVFNASRKLGRTHQNALVFYKGEMMASTKAAAMINKELKQRRQPQANYEKALIFYNGDPGAIHDTLGLMDMKDDELAEFIDSELDEL